MLQKESNRMTKLMLGVLLAFPTMAQVSNLVPSSARVVGGMVTPAIPRPFEAALTEVPRESVRGRTLYRWSIAAVLSANAADVASSWRNQEANPFLSGSGGQFGATSIAIKSGFVATSLLIQHVALRHRPDLYKKLAWLNFGTAGVFGGVAKYNMGVR